MHDDASKHGMQLVPNTKTSLRRKIEFALPSMQASLFPIPRPGLVIFVYFPDVTAQEFFETLEKANPAYVLEMRSSPRFDIGRLNRSMAFKVFQRQNATYLDLTSPLMGKIDGDCVISSLRDFVQNKEHLLDRPVVILIRRSEYDEEFTSRVVETITTFGTTPTDVFDVPDSFRDTATP